MNRSIFVRLLLSLMLLLSQQMAALHALEHLGGALATQGEPAQVSAGGEDEANELARAVAQHQNCHQCLAFAQLAAPLASATPSFAPAPLAVHTRLHDRAAFHPLQRVHAFQARAPPLV